MDPGSTFTTLHFLCNLQIDALSKNVVTGKFFQPIVIYYSSFIVSYEDNEVLWIQYKGLYSQHFIFFVAYELAQ